MKLLEGQASDSKLNVTKIKLVSFRIKAKDGLIYRIKDKKDINSKSTKVACIESCVNCIEKSKLNVIHVFENLYNYINYNNKF